MIRPIKNILITGATSGIGRALAYEYAQRGARMILLARRLDLLRQVTEELKIHGTDAEYVQCDVRVMDQMRSAISFAEEKLGSIDLAILNAGIGEPEWIREFKSEELKKVFEVNLFGIAHALELLIPIMRKQGFGIIAGVSSMSDNRGFPGSASYTASKAAATLLLESARVELKKYGIDVVTIRPGFVRSEMTAKNEFYMPLLMQTEKAARIIAQGIEKRKPLIQFPYRLVFLTEMIRLLPIRIFDYLSTMVRPGK